MSIELFHHRKPRSDSALKSFSQKIQDEIVHYAHDHSLREVQAWLQEKHHVKRALSTISDFLSWSRTIEQRYRNMGAVEALVAPLGPDGAESKDTPDLTPEELRTHARQYFLETIIHDCNVSAWHQSERIALKREEMDLKQQQLELKRQELELKREQLELKRKIHKRNSDERVVKTHIDPQIRALAQDDDISYSDKVEGIKKIMFGDGNVALGVEPLKDVPKFAKGIEDLGNLTGGEPGKQTVELDVAAVESRISPECDYNCPHPVPLPQERRILLDAFGDADDRSTSPALGFGVRLESVYLLLREKAGMGADNHNNNQISSDLRFSARLRRGESNPSCYGAFET